MEESVALALSKWRGVRRRNDEGRLGAAKTTNAGGAMAHYMLLVYQEEVDPAEQAEREREMPLFVELHRSLREAGLLVGGQGLHSTARATSARGGRGGPQRP